MVLDCVVIGMVMRLFVLDSLTGSLAAASSDTVKQESFGLIGLSGCDCSVSLLEFDPLQR